MGEVEQPPVSGEIRNRPIRWITFQQDDKDRLYIQTLYGGKVIDDPERANEIIKLLTELSDLEG